jgi:hypothetical protein
MSDDSESRDAAEPKDAVIEGPEASEDAETEFNPFSEVADEFQPGPAVRVMGPDGLPQTVDTTTPSDIPALSKETLVCMGDFSKFVCRDKWGCTTAEFEPSEVTRMPNGEWVAPMRLVVERLKPRPHWSFLDQTSDYHPVSPIRPPCRHYVRQLGSFEHNAQNKATYRLCAARRTTEGTFMSLRDTGLWGCDMREPYDAASVKAIDDFDAQKIAEGARRQHLPMFQGYGGGIFDTTTPQSEPKEN